ncbi:MFS transporter [Antrihabitans sp. YC2-6]|uniref:MFS transporter n=1 Tax=Antrihabitans sp. YC2-6 TaxID=2799498 RepID=UPI0018F6E36F|nr:MFS transporter [Antrihabitans sp. YC2-6]MBJ8345688.1 MFS transporter [Antrihabitans sp. YC2-6]
MTQTTFETPGAEQLGTWRELLVGRYAPVAAVLAGGVLLEASNVYITTSLLPTIVADIGGEQYYAWTMTSFLTASIITAMLVSRILTRYGSVNAYVAAFGLFAVGSLLAALSPNMLALLVGRAVQGLGGGLLAGLGYALLQRALPQRLWARGAALVSAMWGVGNILGPLAGGLFAQFDSWRGAFGLLVASSAVLIVMTVRVIPRTAKGTPSDAVPLASLLLLTLSVAAVSIAGIVPHGIATIATIALGLGFGAWFIDHDRRAHGAVLPAVTFHRGSTLPWVYVTVGVLAFGIGTEAFIPYFGQEVGGLAPLVAGFLGAAISLGWSLSQIASATATRRQTVRRLTTAGPLVLGVGLALYGGLTVEAPSGWLVLGWFFALFAAGTGIGIAFPHLTVSAFASSSSEEEGAKAASGINTVFIIASAFSAALAGVLVNLGDSVVDSAHLLLFAFAAVAALGVVPAARATLTERNTNGDRR